MLYTIYSINLNVSFEMTIFIYQLKLITLALVFFRSLTPISRVQYPQPSGLTRESPLHANQHMFIFCSTNNNARVKKIDDLFTQSKDYFSNHNVIESSNC